MFFFISLWMGLMDGVDTSFEHWYMAMSPLSPHVGLTVIIFMDMFLAWPEVTSVTNFAIDRYYMDWLILTTEFLTEWSASAMRGHLGDSMLIPFTKWQYFGLCQIESICGRRSNVEKMIIFVFDRVKENCGNGKNAGYLIFTFNSLVGYFRLFIVAK